MVQVLMTGEAWSRACVSVANKSTENCCVPLRTKLSRPWALDKLLTGVLVVVTIEFQRTLIIKSD